MLFETINPAKKTKQNIVHVQLSVSLFIIFHTLLALKTGPVANGNNVVDLTSIRETKDHTSL